MKPRVSPESLLESTADFEQLANALDRDVFLRRLPRRVLEVSGVDAALFLERTGDRVVVKYAAGHRSSATIGSEIQLAGRPYAHGDLIVVPDVLSYWTGTEGNPLVDAEGIRSLVAVPVWVGDEMEGIVLVVSRSATEFSPEVRSELARMADVTSNALYLSDRVRDTVATAVSENRRQLAIELHDSVGQMLFSIGMTARALSAKASETDGVQQLLAELEVQTSEAAATLRRAMATLSAPMLNVELEIKVAEDVHAFERRSGVRAHFLALNATPELPTETCQALRLTCREALLNAEKHARCGDVIVTLFTASNGVGLTVVDNGTGFEPTASSGLGLAACSDRLERLGGSLTITANDDGPGTSLRAWVPC